MVTKIGGLVLDTTTVCIDNGTTKRHISVHYVQVVVHITTTKGMLSVQVIVHMYSTTKQLLKHLLSKLRNVIATYT